MTRPITWWLAGQVRCPWCYQVAALAYSDGLPVRLCRSREEQEGFASEIRNTTNGRVALESSLDAPKDARMAPTPGGGQMSWSAKRREPASWAWCTDGDHVWALTDRDRDRIRRSRSRVNIRGRKVWA